MKKTLDEIAAMPVGLEAAKELVVAYNKNPRRCNGDATFLALILGPLGRFITDEMTSADRLALTEYLAPFRFTPGWERTWNRRRSS